VMLEPDVREYFPTSESVNKALRSLIEIMPKKLVKKIAEGQASKKRYET